MDAPRTRVRLRVSPRSRCAGIAARHGDGCKVHVTAAAESGRANDAVIPLLAETLAVPGSHVTVVAGHTARDKVVELTGLSPDEAERRVTAVGKDGSE